MSVRRAASWCAAVVVWLVLAATYSIGEAVAAAIAATVVVALAVRVADRDRLGARTRLRWYLQGVKLPHQVVLDLGILVHRLAHPEEGGAFRRLPFDVRGDDPYAVGRRILLTAAASLGPNTYIIDWDVERQEVLVHQLERGPRVLPARGGTYE